MTHARDSKANASDTSIRAIEQHCSVIYV